MSSLLLLTLDNNESQPNTLDYQSELKAVWSERVKTDTSGILENSVLHSWGCRCCTQDPEYLKGKRKYRKRNKKEEAV